MSSYVSRPIQSLLAPKWSLHGVYSVVFIGNNCVDSRLLNYSGNYDESNGEWVATFTVEVPPGTYDRPSILIVEQSSHKVIEYVHIPTTTSYGGNIRYRVTAKQKIHPILYHIIRFKMSNEDPNAVPQAYFVYDTGEGEVEELLMSVHETFKISRASITCGGRTYEYVNSIPEEYFYFMSYMANYVMTGRIKIGGLVPHRYVSGDITIYPGELLVATLSLP